MDDPSQESSGPGDPPLDPKSDDETIISDYLALHAKGNSPDLDQYLSSLDSDEQRNRCRQLLEGALNSTLPHWSKTLAKGSSTGLPDIPGFRVDRRVGKGGLGTVYEAWDLSLERRVALKVLQQGAKGDVQARILNEARKAAGLHNPFVVTIFSVTEGGSLPAIVMEYVEGFALDKVVQPLTYSQKAKLLLAVAQGLAAAHDKGIIHRDLKPDNVLVTPDLQPKILDFGLAQSVGVDRDPTGVFAGTPLYASPEQAQGVEIDPASDVFSFGSLMYKVLTGREPFVGKSVPDILELIRTSDPPFPRTLDGNIPEDLQAICLACLARNPKQRPTAEEVAADLSRYFAGEPPRLRPALYGDILRRRVSEHMNEIEDWKTQGMVSDSEGDRLYSVYRRILADEDHWIVDARRLSLPQTVLYSATWAVVLGIVLLVWLARDELSSMQRWLLPCVGWIGLAGVGLLAHLRKEILASAAFLAGAVLGAGPVLLSILAEGSILAGRPEGVAQLLPAPYSNLQILAACITGLALSIFAIWRLRLTAFAWTSSSLGTLSYMSLLLVWGWLDQKPEIKALWCLPLLLSEVCAHFFERARQFRWAFPFHLTALLTLVAALDVMAMAGPTLEMLGLNEVFAEPSLGYFSLALNGIVFFGFMVFMETSASLDLRRGGRILEILVPLHLLGPLYWNARRMEKLGDLLLYVGCVLLLLALAPWRSRGRFLLACFVGMAFGSYLAIDLEFVSARNLPIVLGLSGLAAGAGTYAYLRFRS